MPPRNSEFISRHGRLGAKEGLYQLPTSSIPYGKSSAAYDIPSSPAKGSSRKRPLEQTHSNREKDCGHGEKRQRTLGPFRWKNYNVAHGSTKQNDDARFEDFPQPPVMELEDSIRESPNALPSRSSINKTSPTRYTKDIICPVEEYITKWPAPKRHVTVGQTGLLRDKDWTDKASDTSNEHMVALRLQQKDLSSNDYTEADYVLLEMSVINEQAFKLREMLDHFNPFRNSRTANLLKSAQKVPKSEPERRKLIKWCQREPQARLGFWNSDEMVEQLLRFNKDRNLTIFDMLTMMEDIRRCTAEGKNELTFSIPPSHLVSSSPRKKIRAPRKTKPVQTRQSAARTLSIQLPPDKQTAQPVRPAQPPPPSSQPVFEPEQHMPDRETPIDADGRWPAGELLLQQPCIPSSGAIRHFGRSPEDLHDYPEFVAMHRDDTDFSKVPQELMDFDEHAVMQEMASCAQTAPQDFQNPAEYFDMRYGPSLTLAQESGIAMQPFADRLSNPSFLTRDTQPFELQNKPQSHQPPIPQAAPVNIQPSSEVPIDPALLFMEASKPRRRKGFEVYHDEPQLAKLMDHRPGLSKILQDVTNLTCDRAAARRTSEEFLPLAPGVSGVAETASPRSRNGHVHGRRKKGSQEKLPESTFPQMPARGPPNDDFQEQTATLNAVSPSRGDRAALKEIHRVAKRKPEDEPEREDVQRQRTCGIDPPPLPIDRIVAVPPQSPIDKETLPTEFGLNQAHTEPFGGAEASIRVSTVPSCIDMNLQYQFTEDLHEPQYFDPAKPRKYAEHLSQQHAFSALRPQDTEYVPIPPMEQTEAWNLWLNSKLAPDSELPALFRNFTYKRTNVPAPDDVSLLARCVRFAQSDAQKEIDWRAHPSHVHEIIQRTNVYGLELLISREQVVVKTPVTRKDFELIMAIRTVHVLWQQQDRTQHVAADIPGIIQMLHEQNPFLPEFLDMILEKSDGDVFLASVKEMCDQFMQSYPEIGRSSISSYEERLAQQDPNPANAHMFEYLIEIATQGRAEVVKIGDDRGADLENL